MKLISLISFYCLLSCAKEKINPPSCTPNLKDTVVANFEIKGISYVATNAPIENSNIQSLENVNCNWIAQIPFAFGSVNSNIVTYDPVNQWWGETDLGIISTTQFSKANGLKTMMKPQIFIEGTYTGAFKLETETDWIIWENSYRDYILHYAKLSDSLNIEMFCIGTELRLVVQKRPTFWINLIDTIRSFYDGKLIYASNWDDYKEVSFLNKLDFIGIDAYFPISNSITPEVSKMVQNWEPIINEINQFRTSENMNVIFTEIGYKSVDQCAKEPWNPTSTNINVQAQSNAYQAFFEAFSNKPWFKGAFLWKWFPQHESAGGINNKDFTPQNKPAQALIKKCF